MRVVICGSREWDDEKTMRDWLVKVPEHSAMAHGDAFGADQMAARLGALLGFDVKAYPADWKTHNKAAGPIRNRAMLDEFKPDIVLAFTDTLTRGGKLSGTGDCCAAANERGIRVTIIPSRSLALRRTPGPMPLGVA